MYADTQTGSMKRAISECNRRRKKQLEYNKYNNITPKTIVKAIREGIEATQEAQELVREVVQESPEEFEREIVLVELEREMEVAARNLQFERAAELRDQIIRLRKKWKKKS